MVGLELNYKQILENKVSIMLHVEKDLLYNSAPLRAREKITEKKSNIHTIKWTDLYVETHLPKTFPSLYIFINSYLLDSL